MIQIIRDAKVLTLSGTGPHFPNVEDKSPWSVQSITAIAVHFARGHPNFELSFFDGEVSLFVDICI